jgi:hypothetical protein
VLLAIDVSVPSGALRGVEAQALRARQAVVVGLRRGRLALSTAQALSIGIPDAGDAATSYDGALAAHLRLQPRLVVSAGVDAIIGSVPAATGLVAIGAGAGARLRLGVVEVGLGLRTGLGKDGGALWGRVGGLVTVGYRAGPPADGE